MSALKPKRRRINATPSSLEDAILTVFTQASEAHTHASSFFTLPTTHDLPGVMPVPRLSALTSLCERLICVSRPDGQPVLLNLQSEIRNRVFGPAELSSLLFEDDDMDAAPPLCVIVQLLRANFLHVADLRTDFIIKRAMFEIDVPEVCACVGVHAGVNAFLYFLLDGSRGSRCESVLRDLVSVFFRDRASVALAGSGKTRFRLAALVVNGLHDEFTRFGLRVSTVTQWAQQAVTPSRFLDRALRNGDNVIWTPELSGLATDRKECEYLSAERSEEEALMALFRCVPATEASKLYLASVGEVLKSSGSDEMRKEPVTGTWSRLVLLGRRVTDKEGFKDVDENLRRSILSSVTGSLCSPHCLRDACSVAVLICLARRILIPCQHPAENGAIDKHSAVQRSYAIERYEAWFRDLVSRNDSVVVQAMMEPLTQLVPLESLHFLKLNHRVFSSNRLHFRITSDYVSLARVRIRDFDPSFGRILSRGDAAAQFNGADDGRPCLKGMKEVIAYVKEYIKLEHNLPPSLIRQMNFHRHYFRGVVLPLFFYADFVTLRPKDGVLHLDVDADRFDECRLGMINELAFKRKDHAISVSEARKASKAIKDAMEKRKCQKERLHDEPKDVLASVNVGDGSSICDIVEAVLTDESQHGFNGTQVCEDGTEVAKAKEVLLSTLANSIKKCGDGSERAMVATNVLQDFTSAIEAVERKRQNLGILGIQMDDVKDANGFLPSYSNWWEKIGRSLVWLISRVFCDDRVLLLQKHVRYQLFALLCARTDQLSDETVLSLGMFLTVLIVLRGNEALCDVCYIGLESSPSLLKHIGMTLFDCMPICNPDFVLASVKFANHCVSLLSTFPGTSFVQMQGDVCDVNILTSSCFQEEISNEEFIKPIMSFLQWVVSNPWRLDASIKRVRNVPKNVTLSTDAILTFRQAVFLLHGNLSSCVDDTKRLDRWLDLELRCGWGCKRAMMSLFQALRASGTDGMDIIHKTTKFLAQSVVNRNVHADWIVQALVCFHDDDVNSLGVETSRKKNGIQIQSQKINSTSKNVEDCFKRDGVNVGMKAMEFYRTLDINYFAGCLDINQHISHILVHHTWPLPRFMTSYLLRCLNRVSHESMTVTNAYFIANCAFAVDARVSSSRRKNGNKNVVLEAIDNVSKAVRVLAGSSTDGFDEGALEEDRANMGLSSTSSQNILTTVCFQNAHALGIALALYFSFDNQADKTNDNDDIYERVRQVVMQLSTSCGEIMCGDVLDGTIFGCAFLLVGEIDQNGGHDRWMKCKTAGTDDVLQYFMKERIEICMQHKNHVPLWVRLDLTHDKFLHESDGAVLLNMVDNAMDNPERRGRIEFVLAVVLRTLHFVRQDRLEQLFNLIVTIDGDYNDEGLRTVFNNVARAYSRIMHVTHEHGASVRHGLIQVLAELSTRFHGVGNDEVEGLLNRYGEAGRQMLAFMKCSEHETSR